MDAPEKEYAANSHISLCDILSMFGISHCPSARIEGKRDWFDGIGADREYLGTYDASEGWAMFKAAPAMLSALRCYDGYTGNVVEGGPISEKIRDAIRKATDP